MSRFRIALTFLAVLSAQACFAAEKHQSLPVVKTRVRTLAAFKNGLGFVFRSGEGRLKSGWAVIDAIPPAALGTLWIGTASPSQPIMEVISYKDKTARAYDALDFSDLLSANTGRDVTITCSTGGARRVKRLTGRVLSVPSVPVSDDLGPLPGRSSSYGGVSDGRFPGQIVLFKTSQGGIMALNKQSILTVEMPGGAALKTSMKRDVNRAKLRVRGNPARAQITVAYLEKGITWSPGYLVDLSSGADARVTLEAVLSDDVEDLNDVDVSFVVGYPNFLFADQITPLALQQTVSQFVERLARGSSEGGRPMAAAMSQSVAYRAMDGIEAWRPESAYSATQPMPGETNEDLYFYHQPNVTLKKGDRARYTVFSSAVPCEHIYQWNVPDTMGVDDQGARSGQQPSTADTSQVWHSLRLTNTTKQPWTTAPAFTVKGGMPVAQDILTYTPPGGQSTLRLTVATDVRAQQSQTEVSRTPIQILHRDFDEIIVDGKLTVKNVKAQPIKVSVRKSLVGEVKDVGQDGKVSRVIKGLTANNPASEISWDFPLEPGAQRDLTYSYKVLVYR